MSLPVFNQFVIYFYPNNTGASSPVILVIDQLNAQILVVY